MFVWRIKDKDSLKDYKTNRSKSETVSHPFSCMSPGTFKTWGKIYQARGVIKHAWKAHLKSTSRIALGSISFVHLAQNMELVQALSGKRNQRSACSSLPAGTRGSLPQCASLELPESPLRAGTHFHNRNTHSEVPCSGNQLVLKANSPWPQALPQIPKYLVLLPLHRLIRMEEYACVWGKRLFIEEIYRKQQIVVTKAHKR